MTTTAEILAYLDTLAPQSLKMSWDNAGLLCGRREQAVKTILVALDPFPSVIREAIDLDADLLVTHHPLIFRDPLLAVNEDTQAGQCVLTLIEHGIATINAHTNLDLAPGGVNDVLAQTLGLSQIALVNPEGQLPDGQPYGLLRQGLVPQQPLADFLAHVKNTLHCDGLRYVDSGRPVKKVAVGGGACADEMLGAFHAGCDTFVTADVKYNQFRTASDLGLNLIDAGHFHTENPMMPVLARLLQAAFPSVRVIFSEKHTDCMKFFH